jgi:hypothetical protein
MRWLIWMPCRALGCRALLLALPVACCLLLLASCLLTLASLDAASCLFRMRCLLPLFPCNDPHCLSFCFFFFCVAGLMCRCSRCRWRAWPRASPTGRLLLRLCSGSMKVLLRPHEGCIKARLRVYECSNLLALGVERHLVARDLSDYEKLAVAIATQVTATSLSLSPYARVCSPSACAPMCSRSYLLALRACPTLLPPPSPSPYCLPLLPRATPSAPKCLNRH